MIDVEVAGPASRARNSGRILALDSILAKTWDDLLTRSPFAKRIESGDFDRRLYALYLIETYHYTSHNARNQALAGARTFDRKPQYVKYCFTHASEETGHELLALQDLCSLGLDRRELQLPPPLPATEVLIAYLYWISENGNSMQRLGYSFWAERCYRFIGPLLSKARNRLKLEDNQMTFLVAHAHIDDAHGREVIEILENHCSGASDWAAIERVMRTSLRLTGQMLEEVEQVYGEIATGRATAYAFLNAVA